MRKGWLVDVVILLVATLKGIVVVFHFVFSCGHIIAQEHCAFFFPSATRCYGLAQVVVCALALYQPDLSYSPREDGASVEKMFS